MIRRILKWIGWILLVLIALPILAVVATLIVANMDFGQRLIERQTAELTGGMVRMEGLSGRFPDALRVGKVEVADAKGVYTTITGLTLDWSPSSLLHKVVLVDRLAADTVDVARLPESETKTTSKSSGSYQLPAQVDLRALSVGRTVIEAPVVGTAATLGITGSATLRSMTEGTVHLDVERQDSPGQYKVDGDVGAQTVTASVNVQEPAKGLISSIAKLPDLGPIALQASVDGPMDALASKLNLTAGPLKANASGTVDVPHQMADVAVHAEAPAMEPAPGVSWQSVLVDAKVEGLFTKPDANATVRLQELKAAGAEIGALAADVKGNAGQVDLHATVSDLVVPGPKPDLLRSAPLVLDASAVLSQPDEPVTFALHHPLIGLDGNGRLAGTQAVKAHLDLPDLAPLAQAAGVDLKGHTSLDLDATKDQDLIHASLSGLVAVTGGMAPVPALIGDDAHIGLTAAMKGQDITLSNLTLNGRSLSVDAKGAQSGQQALTADWQVALSDLAAIVPDLAGKLSTTGHASGTMNDLAAQADVTANVAAKGYQSGEVTAHIDASGLPNAPKAAINAGGTLLDAPLTLAMTAEQTDGTIHADISKVAWKSLAAEGNLSMPKGATLPTGRLHLAFTRLADLQPLLHQALNGALQADLNADEQTADAKVSLRDVSVPGTASVPRVDLTANVQDPMGNPVIDSLLTAEGVTASSAHNLSARVTAKGPIDAVAVAATANSPDIAGGATRLVTNGTVDGKTKVVSLAKLEAGWKQETLRLLAPARIAFADGVSIDRMRLGFRQAVLEVAGTAGSKLDLTATLRNLRADVAAIASPSLVADGVIAADVRLTGTSSRPEGTVKLTADGLHLRKGAGEGLPPANLVANVNLMGTSARVDTRVDAGQSRVRLEGTAPLQTSGPLDLRTQAHVDLAMLDPILSAQGERARGIVTADATIGGTANAPKVNGTATLRQGDVVDYAMGAHISDLVADIKADGDTIHLTRFSGKAGPGSLGGTGTIGVAGAMPINLHFTANNARPLASDLMTVDLNADVTVQGEVKGDMLVAGTVKVLHADIRIPDKLPVSVAVLPVRVAGQPPPPPPAPSTSTISLNLTLDAPEQVFVRGRGLDAELGGQIHVTGTTTSPQPNGGLHLRRGTMSVVGTTLNFKEGTVSFTGGGISNPSILFVAQSQTQSIVATLTVSGTAKDPKITLSSVPDMPQDEILAQLLFGKSTSKLSPLELAQIASALASLSGGGGGFDPLEALRSGLGLDRLSVGSNTSGNPTVEAGRYVARGVYVGAKQSTNGGGPQATVQVDLAKGLKLETTAGSGSTNATGSSSSTDAASVGLTYQFEY